MNDIFDKILASTPANASAGRVTSKGTHFSPKLKEASHIAHWDAPPKMRTIPKGNAVDLLGAQCGRLRVVGLYDDTDGGQRSRNDAPAKWVVRCACGDYEIRSTKAIRNPANGNDSCRVCRRVVQNRRVYDRLGSRDLSEFIPQKRPEGQ